MPRLILKFDDRVLSECNVGRHAVSIGRLPDNDVVVDNAGVSGRHARVFRQGDQVVVEDLQSTNGTFINDQRIDTQALKDGDQILIGKHTIVFDQSGGDPPAEADSKTEFLDELGGTMLLDTERHRALMAELLAGAPKIPAAAPKMAAAVPPIPAAAPKMAAAVPPIPASLPKIPPVAAAVAPAAVAAVAPVVTPKTVAPPAAIPVGVLTVLDGRADRAEYTLSSHTSMIGKADASLVRLRGWFKPKTALAIARKGGGYSATALGGKTTINGERMKGRRDLQDGDVIQVSGLTLEFHLKAER